MNISVSNKQNWNLWLCRCTSWSNL